MDSFDKNSEAGDQFFEELTGRAKADSTTSLLRSALLAENKTIQEAEGAAATDIGEMEAAKLDDIKKQLIASGHLGSAAQNVTSISSAAAKSKQDENTSLAKSKSMLFGEPWMKPFALAASVMVASLLVFKAGINPTNEGREEYATRGESALVVEAENADKKAHELERLLQSAGAEVALVQINNTEWALAVNVPDAKKIESVRNVLLDAGVKAGEQPPYEVSVQQPK